MGIIIAKKRLRLIVRGKHIVNYLVSSLLLVNAFISISYNTSEADFQEEILTRYIAEMFEVYKF